MNHDEHTAEFKKQMAAATEEFGIYVIPIMQAMAERFPLADIAQVMFTEGLFRMFYEEWDVDELHDVLDTKHRLFLEIEAEQESVQ